MNKIEIFPLFLMLKNDSENQNFAICGGSVDNFGRRSEK
jgi:hypothetical protein